MSINFRHGKFLIKAPIGSGKSFLFFDGPLFALYKNTSRPMLSSLAEEWRVKILVEHHGKYIICIRHVTRTKSWNDAVKSSISLLDVAPEMLTRHLEPIPILTQESDIIGWLAHIGTRESIPCKNETDVQQTLEPFLPPVDVFLNTVLLLQDNKNIFDLTPAERITLLKEIFWLISIDEATERISAEKKTTTALIKAKELSGDGDRKIREYLATIATWCREAQIDSPEVNDFLSMINLVGENVTLTGFTLETSQKQAIIQHQETLNTRLTETQQDLAHITAQASHLRNLTLQRETLAQELTRMQRNIASLDEHAMHQARLAHEQAHQTLLAHQQHIYTIVVPLSPTLNTQIEDNAPLSLVQEQRQGIRHAYTTIVQQGKDYKKDKDSLETQMTMLQQRHTETQTSIDDDQQSLTALQSDYEKKKAYFCRSINGECPFIEQINEGLFVGLQRNITQLADRIEQKKQSLLHGDIATSREKLSWQIALLEQKMQSLREDPLIKSSALILKTYEQFSAWEKEKSEKESTLSQTQKTRNTLQEQALHVAEWTGKISQLSQQITTADETIAAWQSQQDPEKTARLQTTLTTIKSNLATVQQILITLQRVDDLITQHTTDARAIKQLREREQILTDLYRIFSKDVMIKVLEDSLPFFAEYINNVLAKMVSFHITFAPRKTTSDKLELDITIHDHHGERSIKSLSGGQKAILRLAWTLGVAKMSGSEQLLLDETINNIDHQTIQDVTHMLEDYLTTNDIPLYIVTHSQQLQQMSLWDEVIELIP
jgi:DNA repair exonuclease SbcCD ATPase subunit